MNALAHGPQNFLVPDRGNIFEIAVDNPDGSGPFRRDPINITLGGRRQKSRIELLGGFVCSDGRTHKHIHTHATLDRKSTRLNSSHVAISYAVFCLKKKKKIIKYKIQ